jgi:hypothetical protein
MIDPIILKVVTTFILCVVSFVLGKSIGHAKAINISAVAISALVQKGITKQYLVRHHDNISWADGEFLMGIVNEADMKDNFV